MENFEEYSALLAYAYVGLFLILGSIGLPFPEEIVLLSAGYLAGTETVRFWVMLLYAMCVMMLGDAITYFFSRHYGRSFITNWGKHIFFPIRRLEQIEDYYHRHGSKTVFFSRLVVGFRLLGIIVAGLSKMPPKKFFLYDLLSIVVYLPLVMGIGYLFQYHLDIVLAKFELLKHIIFILVLILIFALFLMKLAENIGLNRKPAPPNSRKLR